jgi:hypothetical protein
MIKKSGSGYAVVHCHGKDKGKAIGKHKTYQEALAQHRAIEANKHKHGKTVMGDRRIKK